MYGQDRKELRQVFFRAWQRQREQQPLVGIERIIASVALRHPEYHTVLENRASHEDHEVTLIGTDEQRQSRPGRFPPSGLEFA